MSTLTRDLVTITYCCLGSCLISAFTQGDPISFVYVVVGMLLIIGGSYLRGVTHKSLND